MIEQNKKGLKLSIFLLLAYLPVHVIYTKILLQFLDMPMRFSVTLQMVSYIAIGSAGIALFWNEFKEGISLWKEHTGKTFGILIAAFISDILLSNLALIPLMFINPDYQSLNEHSVSELQGKFPALLLIIALGIMGPVTEEVVFRLAPILSTSSTRAKSKKLIAILVAAALFMLVHMHAFTLEEFLYNLPQFVTGIVYGAALVLSKNATVPVLLHIMNNLPALILVAFLL